MADTRVRIEFEIHNQDQWYAIISELNKLFGRGNWRGQQKVKRKFYKHSLPLRVWFELPNEKMASYLQLKYSGFKTTKI